MKGSPEGDPIFPFLGRIKALIRNLNQLDFKDYGTVSPERASQPRQPGEDGRALHLRLGSLPEYRAVCPVQLWSDSGMAVLSVAGEGEEYQHFYLDKPVCIHAGVRFRVSPFRQENATAYLSAETFPEVIGTYREQNDYQLTHRIRVTELYTFFYQEKERGFFFPGESHAMPELTYVDQGTLHSVVDGQELVLEQGDLVVYGAGQWHMQYADVEVAPRYVTLSFHLEGSDLAPLLNRKLRPTQAAVSLLQQMLRERDRTDEYAPDMLLCQLTMLILSLLRQQDAPAQKLQSANSVNAENEIIRRAQQFISTHIRERLSVPYVARMADVSPSYLTALFHKNLQISPGEYIRRIKLQESKQMIREGNMNFTEIAAALQYSTVHHFSRQFKEKFGITPTEYARSVR